ncbi:hypothetical protein F0237_21950 [Vibrio tubiashii]|uniref:Uncharacterized protein n=1 Tax=Vibrio tubiashii TaxID=29498 RepID=A0AAE5GUV4_9VIBR|nr:hypothetical protein [Vibrio tubiashii]NOI83326.1 hypothetical protein [Vibrio tubiashii]
MWFLKSNLQHEQWERVKDVLKPALKDHFNGAEHAVKQGEEQVFRLGDTVMLLRRETDSDGSRELVVVALVGDMAVGTLGALNHARALGFDSIRAHFFRAGAERFIRNKLGLPVDEIERRGDERILRIRFADMGGRSSSQSRQSTVTTTTNTSGSAAAGRDNYGVMLAGVNDSDINLSMTDHGAMAIAGELAEEAFDFGSFALQGNTEVSQHAIDSIKSMAGQQTETTKAALAMANSAKSREQTGGLDSNNDLLKNVSLIVGIAGTIITVAVLFKGGKS